ncbi:MAG: hypothetical protein WDN69_04060 [Aliidongia sp.]
MRDRCVDAEHQIQIGDQRRRIGEIAEIPSGVEQIEPERRLSGLRCRRPLLQADELYARAAGERCQRGQRQAAPAIDGMGPPVVGTRRAGPDQADPRLIAHGAEPFGPMPNRVGLGSQIGRHGRDRRSDRAEQARQAEQRNVEIIGRGIGRRLDGLDAGDRSEQPEQRRRRQHHHPPGPFGQRCGITDELQAVAQPLLAMDQDRAALEALALPERTRQVGHADRAVRHRPARAETGEALAQLAGQQMARRLVHLRAGIVRPQRQRALISGERRRRPLQALQRGAQIVVDLGILGPGRQRAFITGNSLGKVAFALQQDAEIVVRLAIVRIGTDRLAIGGNRLFDTAFRFEHQGQTVMRDRVIRASADHAAIPAGRLCRLAALGQHRPQADRRIGVIDLQRQRAAIARCRLVRARPAPVAPCRDCSAPARNPAWRPGPAESRRRPRPAVRPDHGCRRDCCAARQIRTKRQRLRVMRRRLVEPSRLAVQIAEIVQRLGVIRPQRQRAGEARRRLLGAALALERTAEIVVIARFGAAPLDRLADQRCRRLVMAELQRHDAEQIEALGMAGIEGQDLAIERSAAAHSPAWCRRTARASLSRIAGGSPEPPCFFSIRPCLRFIAAPLCSRTPAA